MKGGGEVGGSDECGFYGNWDGFLNIVLVLVGSLRRVSFGFYVVFGEIE